MDEGALLLLFGGMGRLEDQDCLGGEKEAGGVEELEGERVSREGFVSGIGEGKASGDGGIAYWVGGEEYQRVDEDAGPDGCCELSRVRCDYLVGREG